MVVAGRARTTVIEIDLSERVPGFPGVYGVMVLDTRKGTFDPYLVTSQTDFLKRYTIFESIQVGENLGLFEALAFLEKGNKLWVVRAENGAKYGGCLFSQDKPYNEVGVNFNSTLFTVSLKAVTKQDKEIADMVWKTTGTGEMCIFELKSKNAQLPDGIIKGDKYYLVPYDKNTYSYSLASSVENALNGQTIEFSGDFVGDISLFFGKDLANSEVPAGMTDPSQYQMNTSDGQPAGINCTFTVDMDNDQLTVDKKFYESCATGDELTIGGLQENLPEMAVGLPINIGDNVYCIKIPQEGVDLDKYKIQIARTEKDSKTGNFLNFATQGKGFILTFAKKSNTEEITNPDAIDVVADTITVSNRFYDMCANDDKVTLSVSGGQLPTVAGEALSSSEGSVYYLTKGLDNKIQLSVEENGPVINFIDSISDGTTLTLKIINKENSQTVQLDMSNDTLTVNDTYYTSVETGYTCRVTSDGKLPAGLVSGKNYYVIKTDTENKIMLATTKENAQLGVPVDITDAGEIDAELGFYHTITDTHNTVYTGFMQNCMLVCSKTPTAEDIYVTLQHYPYGSEDTWTEADKVLARTLVEPGSFYLSVYKKYADGQILQVEKWLMSRKKDAKDGSQTNIYCEEVARRSQYINVYNNPAVSEDIYPTNQPTILKVANGFNGNVATTGSMILGVEKMANTRRYNCTIIMDAGYAVPAYQQAIIRVCESRQFTAGILSTRLADELSANYVQDLCNYRDIELNSTTSYAAIYTPHLLIYDKYNNREIYVSPTGHVGANISDVGANQELWYPVAGNTRGVLDVLGLSRIFEDGDEDILYDDGINIIDFSTTKGIRIWGQKTLLRKNSALDRLNVRLLLVVIEPAMKSFLDDFLFEINDDITRSQIKTGLESYLDGIKARRGIYDYKVFCDSSNNTNEDIDSHLLNVHVFIQPTISLEYINLYVVITRTGVSMSMSLVQSS